MRCCCSAFEITLFSRQNAPILTSTFFFSYYHLSFQCLTVYLYRPSKCGCLRRAVRGTWNFVRQQATLAHGRASEVHMNMDVNLHRLPDKIFCLPKFLVPLTGLIPHPHPADSADIRSKQAERQFIIKKKCI